MKKLSHGLLVGPIFAAAALVTPTWIALFSPLSSTQADLPGGALFTLQRVLLMIGLSLGVVAGALAVYRWSTARRLLHLGLLFILLELFYRFAYGGAVSSGILLAIPETSERETTELLAGHPFLTVGLTLVALLTIYALIRSWKPQVSIPWRWCIQLAAVSASMILASLAIGKHQLGDEYLLRSVALAELQETYPFDIATALGGVSRGLIEAHRLAATRAAFEFPDVRDLDKSSGAVSSEVYVVVIGETSRRANWSLFGYPRATTPRLEAIKDDLVVFTHVTSNATNTILSVPLALTRAAPATRGLARSEKSVISLLKQAGYQTFWISNQARSDALSNPISQIAGEADYVSFPEDMSSNARRDGFDSNLLTRLDERLSKLPKDGKAVVFLHMEGSHFGYKERYPGDFAQFDGGRGATRMLPPREMRLIDEYDNSVYFTDYIVRGVIEKLANRGGRAGLIFFSDHGERLFDNGLSDSDFGHGFPTISREEIDIPLLVWLSRGYREANTAKTGRLILNAQSVAQLHNLFETIVDLAGIDYANRNASLSLFSDELKSPSKLEVLNTEEETVALPIGEFDLARR